MAVDTRIIAAVLILVIIVGIGLYMARGGGEEAPAAPAQEEAGTAGGQQQEQAAGGEQATSEERVKVLVLFDVGGRGDLSFNDMAYLGAERAMEELGVEVDFQTPPSIDVMPQLLESVSAEGEYDLIVLVGFLWQAPLSKVAPNYPDQKYALIDSALEGDYPNVASYVFREQEVASLIGVLAADIAKNLGSDKAGAVAGMSIPPLWRFHVGYLYGIQYYNQETGSNVQLVWTYTGKFDDPVKGKEVTQQMIQQGVRVFYGLAGLTHLGMFDAVREAAQQGIEAVAIGQDASQEWYDPYHIILSGMKRVDNAVYYAIKSVVDGNFTPGVNSLGLKEGGLGISDEEIVRWFAEQAAEQGRLQGMTPDEVVQIVMQQREKYISDTAWQIVGELEQKIKNGEIAFVSPASAEEYDSIIQELQQGNLDAALSR